MEKLILGVLGEKFAGKDAVANYLVEKHGADHFRFSHILDDILKLLNLPVSRGNEIALGLGLREIFGRQVLAPAIVKRVQESKKSLVVVNGLRMDEVGEIKKVGGKIVYVTAPAELRFARYQNRHEKADDGSMDYIQFVGQEQSVTEVDIPVLGQKADFRIDNTGTLEELYQKAENILEALK